MRKGYHDDVAGDATGSEPHPFAFRDPLNEGVRVKDEETHIPYFVSRDLRVSDNPVEGRGLVAVEPSEFATGVSWRA